jgi:predicted P-loop ATPase
MTDKKITPIKEKPRSLASFKGVIEDYKKLSSSELLNKIASLIHYDKHDAENLQYLYHQEMKKRLEQARKDGKRPEVSLHVFREIMRIAEIEIFQNMMTHRVEIKSKNFKSIEVPGLAEEQRYLGIREVCREFNFPANLALEYIKLSVEAYHPVINWIKEKPVDGIDRFDDLFDTLNCRNENQELAKSYLWKWSLQAVRAAIGDKGQASELVLILKGVQAAGKTMWFRSLAPDDFVKTGLYLNPSNKDSVLEANTAWINELGELDGMTRKVDHANLKAFLSKTDDYVRRPYAVVEERIPRKSVFGATVNTESFLVDDTGNRRYLVLEVDNVDHDHKIDMQLYWRQVWECAKRAKSSEPHWLSAEELIQQQDQSEKFRMLDPIIQNFQHNESDLLGEEFFVKDIIVKTSEIDQGKITGHQCKIMKQHLMSIGWTEKRIGKNQYRLVRGKGEPEPF